MSGGVSSAVALVLLRSRETQVTADSLPAARLGSVDKCMGCRGSSPLTAVERRQDIRRNQAGPVRLPRPAGPTARTVRALTQVVTASR